MGNWWKIARLELLLALKDREAVIWSLIAPVAFAWFFGMTFGGGGVPPTRVSIDRGDNPEYVENIFSGLLSKNDIVVDGGSRAKITLPDSLIPAILNGDEADVEQGASPCPQRWCRAPESPFFSTDCR